MSRYIEVAHQPFHATINGYALSSLRSDALHADAEQDNRPRLSLVPRVRSTELMTFVVKLRNPTTRMWGDQIEVRAVSAEDAAEHLAGEHLVERLGRRDDLRVTVWPTPFGSRPCKLFYVPAASS